MEDWKLTIGQEFKDCLKKFPELKNKVGLIIESSRELSGAEGRLGAKRVVVLYIPKILQDKPHAIRPIIFHELSHMIDLENPDRIFVERADEKSKQLWVLLQKNKVIECEVM